MFMDIHVICVTNVLIMPPRLVHFASISSHNFATRWVRHNLDTSVCCGDCNSISEVCCVPHRVLCDSHARIASLVVLPLAFFPRGPVVLHVRQWKAQLRVSPLRRFLVKISVHNMWNPLLELLFRGQISGVFVLFVDEIDLAKIALSCHFALDLLCCKEDAP